MEKENTYFDAACESGAQKLGNRFVDRILNSLVNFIQDKYGKAQVLTKNAFQSYLLNTYTRLNKVKTLATGADPVPIVGPDNIYVNVGVAWNGKEIDTSTVENLLSIGNNILILGTGGIGKSMLMRYLFLNTVDCGRHIPVFVEMRKISGQKTKEISILKLVYTCMKDYDAQLPEEQLEYSLQHGGYLFLFDGFDEVREEQSNRTATAIQAFCSKYPKNACIITSREWRDFSALETFHEVKSLKLKKEQAICLASKLWKRDEKTEEFCRQLDESLFENHHDFAENPLLLTMMFLTFMYNNSIPNYLSDFYKKAYDALYSTHDSRNKGNYCRDFCCQNIEEHTFKAIFSHLCFQTCFREEYEFTNDQILTRIDQSIKKAGATVTAADYLMDLQKAVCLIILDGDTYYFSHRSFQAYFAAVYTSEVLTDSQQKQLFARFLGIQIYWNMRDYYTLLAQIEPERFGINVMEHPIRLALNELSHSEYPDISMIRLLWRGIRIKHIGDKALFFILKTTYVSNAMQLIREIILKGQVVPYDKVAYEDMRESCDAILYKLRPTYPEFSLSFKELDTTNLITNEERNTIYQWIIQTKNITEWRQAMEGWLEQLDTQQNAFKAQADCENFLDSL